MFCINPGRSGSNYLSELLGTARDVVSFHEAEPTMTHEYIKMINTQSYAETASLRRRKVEAIKKILETLPPGAIYCETNHMFIKTFYDVVFEDLKSIEVIILRRDLASVLKSFIELNYFSPNNPVWSNWMSSPNAATAAVQAIAEDSEMDQYDLCIAYLIDIEGRAQRFQRELPWVKVHEVWLENLNNFDTVKNFFDKLRITPTTETQHLVGRIVNERSQTKKFFNNPIDLKYCHQRIAEYIAKAKSYQIRLPEYILKQALPPRRSSCVIDSS